jgi:hypothetical protein
MSMSLDGYVAARNLEYRCHVMRAQIDIKEATPAAQLD